MRSSSSIQSLLNTMNIFTIVIFHVAHSALCTDIKYEKRETDISQFSFKNYRIRCGSDCTAQTFTMKFHEFTIDRHSQLNFARRRCQRSNSFWQIIKHILVDSHGWAAPLCRLRIRWLRYFDYYYFDVVRATFDISMSCTRRRQQNTNQEQRCRPAPSVRFDFSFRTKYILFQTK